jgi:hypothetical protein
VLVGALVVGAADLREPTAMNLITEVGAQRGEPVGDERVGAWVPEQRAQREDVRHPRRDPQLARPLQVRRAVGAQPREAALGVA